MKNSREVDAQIALTRNAKGWRNVHELAASESRNQRLIDSIPDIVYSFSIKTGSFYYSPRVEEILGYSPEDLDENPSLWRENLHPDDRAMGDKAVRGLIDGKKFDIRYRIRDSSGKWHWMHDRNNVIQDGGSGATIDGLITDITAHMQTEEALKSSEARYRAIVEEQTEFIARITPEGVRTYVNAAWCGFHGKSPRALVGHSLYADLPPTQAEKKRAFLAGFSRENPQGDLNLKIKRGDGKVRDIQWRGRALFDAADEIVEFQLVGRDVTDYRELEKALQHAQRMEMLGQLTGGIAHDFNNLLAALIGNAELLEGRLQDADAEVKWSIEAIKTMVERGSSLTSRLLAFSRKQQLAPVACDVAGLVDDLCSMLCRTLCGRIELRVRHVPGLWPALTDPHQFENALTNLVINARDAMSKTGTLTISTANATLDTDYAERHHELEPGDYVIVTVSDSGHGMSPKVLERVFEPFFTTKEVGEGSGLGLSMVYGFAKQSKGHLTIDSKIGEGTTVRLYLPRSDEVLAVEPAEDRRPRVQPGTGHVLVIEDDPEVRRVLVRILNGEGYQVIQASDGRKALEMMETQGPFDLLCTDIVLPGDMNGLETAEAAETIQPDIKVLFTSGYAEDAPLLSEKLPSAVKLLRKPYRRGELLEQVSLVLNGKASRVSDIRRTLDRPVPS